MSFTVDKTKVITYPPSALRGFHVYGYEWIDNLHFILAPREFIADPTEYVAAARERFLDAGWHGDGRIGLLWLPPFVFPNGQQVSAVGIVVWHVKQEGDGTSWLLSPIELPFAEFKDYGKGEDVIERLFPAS